jgi:hypothetical protein
MKTYHYRGEAIRECEYPGQHSGKWIIQAYHYATGNPMVDQECPHYHTLAEAKADVRHYSRVS